MANELKLAKAAREIARELNELPAESPHPFGRGLVFLGDSKAPCCAIGHVIQRAGLTDLAKGRQNVEDDRPKFRSSTAAIRDVCGKTELPGPVGDAIFSVVEANDDALGPQIVAGALYNLAEELELAQWCGQANETTVES